MAGFCPDLAGVDAALKRGFPKTGLNRFAERKMPEGHFLLKIGQQQK
jgi:hypothetical protein